MYNWSIDIKELKKNKEQYTIWKIEQMVNFGLNSKKLKERDVKKYWKKFQFDPARKRFLQLCLYGRKHSD